MKKSHIAGQTGGLGYQREGGSEKITKFQRDRIRSAAIELKLLLVPPKKKRNVVKESERIRGSESSKSGVKLTRRDDLGLGRLHLRNPHSSGQPKATTKRTPAANFVFSSFSHVSHFFSLPTDELSSQAFFKTQLRSRISRLRPQPP